MKFRVSILQKVATVNPADKVVLGALHQMGYEMTAIRLGRYFDIEIADGEDLGTDPTQRLSQALVKSATVNPVMEDWKIELTA